MDFKNDINMSGNRITGIADGQDSGDVVSFQQFQAALENIKIKAPTKLALNADFNISKFSASGAGLEPGDRILVNGQSIPTENGIYEIDSSGIGLIRSSDADVWKEMVDCQILDLQTGDCYRSDMPKNGIIGVDAPSFKKILIGATMSCGMRLVTGDGVNSSFTIDLGFQILAPIFQVFDNDSNKVVMVDITYDWLNSYNLVRLDFSEAPANGKIYRLTWSGRRQQP